MFVCPCVCAHVYLHACMHACAFVCMFVCPCVHMYVCVSVTQLVLTNDLNVIVGVQKEVLHFQISAHYEREECNVIQRYSSFVATFFVLDFLKTN